MGVAGRTTGALDPYTEHRDPRKGSCYPVRPLVGEPCAHGNRHPHDRRHQDVRRPDRGRRPRSRGAARRALRVHRAQRRREDDDHPHRHVDSLPRRRRGLHPRARVGARSEGPHRLPAGRARPLQADEGARVPPLHGAAQGRGRRRSRPAHRGRPRARGPARGRDQALRRAVEGHVAEGAARGRDDSPPRPADSRRAVQRPRPREHAHAARPHPRGARPGRHHPVLDARDAAGRGDLPAHRHGARGPQGARRRARRHPQPVRPAVHPARAARSRRRHGGAGRDPGGGARAGHRRRVGDPAPRGDRPGRGDAAHHGDGAGRAHRAHPSRLEDVFIRIVAGGAYGDDEDRLRAALREPEGEEAPA